MHYVTSIFWNSEQRRIRTFWRVISFVLVWIIGFSLLSSVVLTLFAPGLLRGFMVTAARLGWSLVALWFTSIWFDRRTPGDVGFILHDRSRRWLWSDFVGGLAVISLLFTTLLLIDLVTGTVEIVGVLQAPDGSFLPAILLALWIAVAVGITEEVVFRAYVLRNAAEGLGGRWAGKHPMIVLALIVSSIVFALFHSGNSNASELVYHVLSGIFFGLAYLLTGSLALPIGLHIANNFFILNVFSSQHDAVTLVVLDSVRDTWTDTVWGPYVFRLLSIVFMLGYVRWRYGTLRFHPGFTTDAEPSFPEIADPPRVASYVSQLVSDQQADSK